MGKCVDRLPHSCGTRKGLQVFISDDGTKVDGYCYACGTVVRHPYGEERSPDQIEIKEGKTEEEVAEQLAEIDGYAVVDLPHRKLRAADLDDFGVKVALNQNDGKTPDEVYYPYRVEGTITGYKVKLVARKQMWSVGHLKGVDLFGWDEAIKSGAKRLIVFEGEDDAIAARKVLKKYTRAEYADNIPACVSLIHGAQSAHKDLSRLAKKINRHFKEVVLCFDKDQAGEEATEKTLKVLGDALTVDLPCKDANECLLKGFSQALFKALTFNVQKKKNSRIILGEDIADAAMAPASFGQLTWPWDHINDVTRGIRYGETYFLGAGVKMGKSEIVNSLASHFMHKHRVKVFLAKPEENIKKTYKLVAGKMVGKVFHDPKVEFDEEAYERARKLIGDKLMLLDSFQHLGWKTLSMDIREAAGAGAKAVFIDPITNLTNGMDPGEANTMLQEISQDLSSMASDLDMAIFIFCHLKAHEGNISKEMRQKKYKDGVYHGLGNCPHELGGDIYSAQFAGSRAMMR
jgi:twinkle protein